MKEKLIRDDLKKTKEQGQRVYAPFLITQIRLCAINIPMNPKSQTRYNAPSSISWGLLGPDTVNISRRSRTLGLGSAVRRFNNLAVPGMGNVWYAKQIYLPLLGIAVASELNRPVSKIKVANAIEAVGCLLSYRANGWQRDARLKGINRLKGKHEINFKNACKPAFYITQPFRMSTVQPLKALGLVISDSLRFNTYELSSQGECLLEMADSANEVVFGNKRLQDALLLWTNGKDSVINSPALHAAISQTTALHKNTRQFLRDLITQANSADGERRKNIFDWMGEHDRSGKPYTWQKKPSNISNEHWLDMHSGSLFFGVRSAALKLLDRLESLIDAQAIKKIRLETAEKKVTGELNELRTKAKLFLKLNHDPTLSEEASAFASKCLAPSALGFIVEKDGTGLIRKGEDIFPGSAFKGFDIRSQEDEEYVPVESGLPDCISQRVHNMFLLYKDFNGSLNRWLKD